MSSPNAPSALSHPPPDDPSFMAASEPVESDIEDEVDQLISDSESPETESDAQNGAGAHRVPGQTLLPAVRLENIMSADGVTGNLSLSKEGLFVLSIAAEEFIKKMAQVGHLRASNERRTAVNYSDMCAATQQYQEFMFLSETIPVPIPLTEAITLRTQKEKEAQEADPTAPAAASSSSRPSASVSKKAKTRANGAAAKHDKRATNKDPRPDSSSMSMSMSVPGDSDGTHSDWTDTRPPRPAGRPGGISVRLSLPTRPSPLVNGHSASTAPSRSGTITPAQPHDPGDGAVTSTSISTHQPQHPSSLSVSVSVSSAASPYPAPPGQPEESWSAQPPPPPLSSSSFTTGPASGFLQGPGSPFGRVAQNPGRTIYSQQFPTE